MPQAIMLAEFDVRILLSILLILMLMPAAAKASEGDWQVAKSTQQVNYTIDKQT